MIDNLLDPVLLHLRINHFPVVLGIVGAFALLLGLVSRRALFVHYAQITLVLAGVFAPVAYFSGRSAEDEARDTWYVEKHDVHEHEEAAEQASIALVITGLLAAYTLFKDRKALQVALLVVALAAAGLVTLAAFRGGAIVHENSRLEGARPNSSP